LNALPGVETACLSNTNALHWVTLTQAPPGPFSVVSELGHRFASHLLRSSKPDPGMYEALESSLGVAPERIVFFDDLGPNVEAARARGWRAWLVDHASETAPQMREALQREGILPSLRP
jgi:putative hydrolase of the HAD superfamily